MRHRRPLFALLLLLPLAASLFAGLASRQAVLRPPPAVLLRASPARASFSIDFSAIQGDEEEDEEEDAATVAAQREASMQKARAELPTVVNMTVADLKTELRVLGLRVTGRKAELVERLEQTRRKMAAGLPPIETEVHRDVEPLWYMLQTANGFERTVERSLSQAIEVQRLQEDIDRIFVPIADGETSVRDASVMPSYILVHMRMTRALHTFITGMQYVVNFVGADHGGRSRSGQLDGSRGFVWPRPLTDDQFQSIVTLTKEAARASGAGGEGEEAPPSLANGARVLVSSGPFKGLEGTVTEVGTEGLATVLLTVMGRQTAVSLPERSCQPAGEAAAAAGQEEAAVSAPVEAWDP